MSENAMIEFFQANTDIGNSMNIDWDIGPDFDTNFLELLVDKFGERFTDFILDKCTYNLGEKISKFEDTDEIINLYITENSLI